MMRKFILAGLIASGALTGPATADGIADVEGARAHERQGSYLTRQEREKLRRYGGNDDGYYSGDYGDGYYGYGPPVHYYPDPGYGYGHPDGGYYDSHDDD